MFLMCVQDRKFALDKVSPISKAVDWTPVCIYFNYN